MTLLTASHIYIKTHQHHIKDTTAHDIKRVLRIFESEAWKPMKIQLIPLRIPPSTKKCRNPPSSSSSPIGTCPIYRTRKNVNKKCDKKKSKNLIVYKRRRQEERWKKTGDSDWCSPSMTEEVERL
jgi:hypothetical protein